MAGIIYRRLSQNKFLEILNKNVPSIDTDAKETYILGDFNINIYESKKYIVHENSTVYNARLQATNSVPNTSNL